MEMDGVLRGKKVALPWLSEAARIDLINLMRGYGAELRKLCSDIDTICCASFCCDFAMD
jgi:hypothetical protein